MDLRELCDGVSDETSAGVNVGTNRQDSFPPFDYWSTDWTLSYYTPLHLKT
jgi:hypothetical protein